MHILASPAFTNEKVNPYNALLYRGIEAVNETDNNKTDSSETVKCESKKTVSEYSHKKAILGKFDILHFHWPDGYINQRNLLKAVQRALLFSLIILIAKLKGAHIVWTVHNVTPHDAFHPKLSRFFMHWFINRCNGLIFMSEESKATFLQIYKPPATIRYAIIPHGHYRSSYPAAIDKVSAKIKLGLPADKKVLLFCGMIKPYKNIDSLIQTFAQTNLSHYELVIAGKPDSPQLAEQLHQHKGDHANIHLFLQFIPDDQLHIYLSAADIVILPYKSILNSGALLLALSFNKPVIAPHIGAFVALQQELGKQWIHSYDGDLQVGTLSKALLQLEALERTTICPLENYDWNKLAALTVTFYQSLFQRSPTCKQQVIS
ncbi:MAG: glycosyltransferase family 4 protein [Pseudomonadota bacterium]